MNEFQKGNPGRRKGAKNKRTVLVEDTAKRLGVDPFEVLCLFAGGEWGKLGYDSPDKITPQTRFQAASDACRYLYSQKRSVEISNAEGEGFKIEVFDFTVKKDG